MFCSKFCVDYMDQQTSKGTRTAEQQNGCDNNNKDKDISPSVNNDNSSFQ